MILVGKENYSMHAPHGAGCAGFNAALAADAELILLLGAALGTRGTALKLTQPTACTYGQT